MPRHKSGTTRGSWRQRLCALLGRELRPFLINVRKQSSGYYHFPRWRGIRPYAGAGAAYAIILRDHDRSVSELDVHNDWGFVVQVGADFRLNDRYELFVDYRKLWLGVDADGLIGGIGPITGR